MNNCMNCKHAEWKKTAAGRLHPSGDGRCRWEMPVVVIPVSFYYMGGGAVPKPSGGHIDRNRLKDCQAWEKADA